MRAIRTLLVDDEPIALRGLQQVLQNENDIDIIGQCADGAAAIASIAELQPDLVFLDIQMPELSGFDVIAAIGLERMPMVIFVTAYDAYAMRAFDVHALDYVLKPIDPQRLQQALQRVRTQVRNRQLPQQEESETTGEIPSPKSAMPAVLREQIQEVLQELGWAQPQRWCKRLAIKQNGRVILIDIQDVDKIEAAGNYVEINVRGSEANKSYLLRESLSRLEQRLDPRQFARIARSSIVNIKSVQELQNMFNGDFVAVLKNGCKVNGSRRYREALDALLN